VRDYASPRAYALIVFGGLVVLLAGTVLPGVQDLMLEEHFRRSLDRLLLFGAAAAALGALDLYLNENRFCAGCGLKVRRPRKRLDAKTESALQSFGGQEPARSGAARAPRRAPVAPDQPVQPLLRMLRAKNAELRRDAATTLRELTGQDFGEDADAWEDWWEENRDSFKEARRRRDAEGGTA
jgi:hypothetical protein